MNVLKQMKVRKQRAKSVQHAVIGSLSTYFAQLEASLVIEA